MTDTEARWFISEIRRTHAPRMRTGARIGESFQYRCRADQKHWPCPESRVADELERHLDAQVTA